LPRANGTAFAHMYTLNHDESVSMKLPSLALALAALAYVGSANAALPLTSQYAVTSSATNISGNQWKFDYTITNLTEGSAGSQLGLDGFSIALPTTAAFVSASSPASFSAGGYWATSLSPFLDLRGNGTQNFTPAAGNAVLTWWGYNTQSVYQEGSTASFSITLDNVSVANTTAAVTSYWGFTTPTASEYTTNQYGNYTTYFTSVASPVAAVPEPETYAMLLAGLGLIGLIARRRQKAA